MRKFII